MNKNTFFDSENRIKYIDYDPTPQAQHLLYLFTRRKKYKDCKVAMNKSDRVSIKHLKLLEKKHVKKKEIF